MMQALMKTNSPRLLYTNLQYALMQYYKICRMRLFPCEHKQRIQTVIKR
jgi:predicted ATP-binding protein involved in virulence